METNYLGKGESCYWLGKVAVIFRWCSNSPLSPRVSPQSDVGVHSSDPQRVLCFPSWTWGKPPNLHRLSLSGWVCLLHIVGAHEADLWVLRTCWSHHPLSATQWALHIFFSIRPSQITTPTSQTRRQSTHREGEINIKVGKSKSSTLSEIKPLPAEN